MNNRSTSFKTLYALIMILLLSCNIYTMSNSDNLGKIPQLHDQKTRAVMFFTGLGTKMLLSYLLKDIIDDKALNQSVVVGIKEILRQQLIALVNSDSLTTRDLTSAFNVGYGLPMFKSLSLSAYNLFKNYVAFEPSIYRYDLNNPLKPARGTSVYCGPKDPYCEGNKQDQSTIIPKQNYVEIGIPLGAALAALSNSIAENAVENVIDSGVVPDSTFVKKILSRYASTKAVDELMRSLKTLVSDLSKKTNNKFDEKTFSQAISLGLQSKVAYDRSLAQTTIAFFKKLFE